MKKIGAIVFIFLFIGLVQAHEFWLLPVKFKYDTGETMSLDFMVGENFEGEYWDLNRHKVERLTMYNRISKTDLTGKEKAGNGKNLEYTFNNVGTHMITLESNDAFIELDPEKFDAYLEEDGLDYIKEQRQQLGEQNKTSRELYRRYAKLLVQVGDRTDDTYKKETGMRIEIVPLQNPYDLKTGDYMDCKVLFQRKPEPHALVKVWSHIGNRIFLQNIYTENDGTIRFPVSNKGAWMVSSVKMIRSASDKAEWQSLWTSLVFEIE